IYGPRVSVVKSNLEAFMDSPQSDDPDSVLGNSSPESAEEKPQPQEKPAHEEAAEIMMYSHLNGTVVDLEDVEDDVFSQKILGEGIAVEPSEGKLYAPCDGKVDSIFDTKHAVNILSADGAEVLLHIGIDTVKLGGKHFESHVSDGQEIKKGDLLITFDIEAIKSEGYKVTTPLIIGNTDDYSAIAAAAKGKISAGSEILKIN
ncbi:MAG: PTS glucose transporter subunit IIA, partial [Oscillospiraceae bacterium]